MDEIISKINDELAAGESPNSLLLKTIKNKEPMCFFLAEYLLSKGADCYCEALFETCKINNLNIINLLLPYTAGMQHVVAYLTACVYGNSATRYFLYRNMDVNVPVHFIFKCLGDMIALGGVESYPKVLEITEEIIKYKISDDTSDLRSRLYVYIAYGAIEGNNKEAIDLTLTNVSPAYYSRLLNFAKTNKKVSQTTIDYLVNNKQMRSCSVCSIS